MDVRAPVGLDRLLLVVLAAGLVGFVALHSYALLVGHPDGTLSVVRLAWFAGLGLVAALSAYAAFATQSSRVGEQSR